MSPMPTPEWEEQIQARLRRERRGIREDHTSDRRDDTARVRAGSDVDLPDPHLLDAPVTALAPLWKTDVIADDGGKWETNGLCFATEEEALEYGRDLSMRWTAVRDFRVREATKEEAEAWIAKGRDEEWER